MPDGPPYVSNVYKADDIVFDTNVAGEGRTGFHVEFDENKHWQVEFKFVRKPGNNNELSAHIAYPGGGGFPHTGHEWTVFWTCNDHYPENPLLVKDVKFDNEDIFIWAEWKTKYDSSVPYDWTNCVRLTKEVGPNGEWARLIFMNTDDSSQVEVRMTRQD
jgi:hypothetical protein